MAEQTVFDGRCACGEVRFRLTSPPMFVHACHCTLHEPARLPPDIHIHTSTSLPWLALADGVAAVPGYYSAGDHWPAQSLEGLAALRGDQGQKG